MMRNRLQPLHLAPLAKVTAVFTDVDGTLTSQGKLTGNTVKALEWLGGHGVKVVLVSGRPAGYGECWARQLPVAGVIVENGALYFSTTKTGGLTKTYLQSAATRVKNRQKLFMSVKTILTDFPGAALSSDSAYTEVDLAIDVAEDASLTFPEIQKLETRLNQAGITAVRSSVHINCWLGTFTKLTAIQHFVKSQWKTELKKSDSRFVYVGDSFNDEPLFKAFSLSVGVANVHDIVDQLKSVPAFVTRAREGRGFGEVVDAIARSRRKKAT